MTRMSCRWLIASRSPTAAMSGAVEAILRIPENGVVNAGKNSSMNRAMWPDAGMVSDSGSPVAVPSRSVNSSETVVGASDVLVRAMPLRTEWGWPGVPLASTYTRKAAPEVDAGTPASDTVVPSFWNAKILTPDGAGWPGSGTARTDPTSRGPAGLEVRRRVALRGGIA